MSELVGKGSAERWYPTPMSILRSHIDSYTIDTQKFPESDHVVSNICYNLQYIEYLRKTLMELNLSQVIQIQTIKSFIVTGTSIIEAIFFLIHSNEKLGKKSNWEEFKIIGKSEFKIEESEFKSETKIWIKTDKISKSSLTFDQMIKRIETKKILSQETQFFKNLNHLRKLRNKIHLQETQSRDTDYHSFWKDEYNLLRKTLNLLLRDEMFKMSEYTTKVTGFLKP